MAADSVTLRAAGRDDLYLEDVRLMDVPTLSGGLGGWEAVARPGRRPLTVWRGKPDPLTMTLPLLFDGWADGKSVEGDVLALEQMAGGGIGSKDAEPPQLEVEGFPAFADQRAGGNARWVVTGIEWGDAIRRSLDGHRVRQVATATLILFTDDDRLERIRRTSARPSYRTVPSRPGDTFEKIAARELKSKRLGGRLAVLNGRGRGAAAVKLKPNTRVKLPSGANLREWQGKGRG